MSGKILVSVNTGPLSQGSSSVFLSSCLEGKGKIKSEMRLERVDMCVYFPVLVTLFQSHLIIIWEFSIILVFPLIKSRLYFAEVNKTLIH